LNEFWGLAIVNRRTNAAKDQTKGLGVEGWGLGVGGWGLGVGGWGFFGWVFSEERVHAYSMYLYHIM